AGTTRTHRATATPDEAAPACPYPDTRDTGKPLRDLLEPLPRPRVIGRRTTGKIGSRDSGRQTGPPVPGPAGRDTTRAARHPPGPHSRALAEAVSTRPLHF